MAKGVQCFKPGSRAQGHAVESIKTSLSALVLEYGSSTVKYMSSYDDASQPIGVVATPRKEFDAWFLPDPGTPPKALALIYHQYARRLGATPEAIAVLKRYVNISDEEEREMVKKVELRATFGAPSAVAKGAPEEKKTAPKKRALKSKETPAPAVDAPAVDAPAVDAPAPKKRAPKAVAPKDVAPKAVAPKAEEKVSSPESKKRTPRAEEKVEEKGRRGRKCPFDLKAKIKVISKFNPKRPGSKASEEFKLYAGSKTVGDFISAGGTSNTLRWDSDHGFIKIGRQGGR